MEAYWSFLPAQKLTLSKITVALKKPSRTLQCKLPSLVGCVCPGQFRGLDTPSPPLPVCHLEGGGGGQEKYSRPRKSAKIPQPLSLIQGFFPQGNLAAIFFLLALTFHSWETCLHMCAYVLLCLSRQRFLFHLQEPIQ